MKYSARYIQNCGDRKTMTIEVRKDETPEEAFKREVVGLSFEERKYQRFVGASPVVYNTVGGYGNPRGRDKN